MASIKDLKKRIGTVKNTQQTTRAMKMVSAAKLRRAQDAIIGQRPYAKMMRQLILTLSALPNVHVKSPLILSDETEIPEEKTVLLVLVTSDRGLCGAFNSNVIKRAMQWIREEGKNYAKVELGFVGKRGYDFYKTKKVNLGPYFQEVGGKVTFAKAKKLSDALAQYYLSGKAFEVKFIYNEFKNAVTQTVVVDDFLPLDPSKLLRESGIEGAELNYIVRPTPDEVLGQLIEKNFAIQAFRVMLDSQASEHGARMSAMENATKNAGDMIRKLTLQYNKQRQAGITKELLEIISGSESQKAS